MSEADLIQIRRTLGSGPPLDLQWGELATSDGDGGLWVGRKDGKATNHAATVPTWEPQTLTLEAGWANYPGTIATLDLAQHSAPLVGFSGVLQASSPPAQIATLPPALAPANYQAHSVQWLGPPGSNLRGAGAITLDPSGAVSWLLYWGNLAQGITWLAFSVFWIPQGDS